MLLDMKARDVLSLPCFNRVISGTPFPDGMVEEAKARGRDPFSWSESCSRMEDGFLRCAPSAEGRVTGISFHPIFQLMHSFPAVQGFEENIVGFPPTHVAKHKHAFL